MSHTSTDDKSQIDFPDPMPEMHADTFLGVLGAAKRLRKMGVLKPTRIKLRTGVAPTWSYVNSQENLLQIKNAISVVKQLRSTGFAKPANGSMFAINTIFSPDGKHQHALVNFADKSGNLFLLDKASERFQIPLVRLRSAVRKWEETNRETATEDNQSGDKNERTLQGFRVFPIGTVGGDWLLVVTERDLLAFKEKDKPTKGIDPDKYKPIDELSILVGATTITLKVEASECARLGKETGAIRSKDALLEFGGMVPSGWRINESGGREPHGDLKSIKRHRDTTKYHVQDFVDFWNADLKEHAKFLRKLVAQKKSLGEIETELKEKGVVGERLKRVLRLAGVVKKKGAYVQAFEGAVPVRKRLEDGVTEKWLRGLLQEGLLYLPIIRDKISRLRKAAKMPGNCKLEGPADNLKIVSHSVYQKPKGTRGIIRHTFWCLPEQTPPTDEEALRIVTEYLASKPAASAKSATPGGKGQPATEHGRGTESAATDESPTQPVKTKHKGGRRRSDKVREVGEYLYRRWFAGEKLTVIRIGAQKEFAGKKGYTVPKDDSHVTEMATRFAERYGKPLRGKA